MIAHYEQAAAERGQAHLLSVQPAFLQHTALQANTPAPSADGSVEVEMVHHPASL